MRMPAKVLVGIILAAGIFFAGYMANRPPVPVVSQGATKQASTYSCPMHPQYTADRPGDCPMCGMRLEPLAAGGGRGKSEPASLDNPGMVVVGAARQQLIGVRTDEVRLDSSSHVLRVPGRIAVDDQRLYRIVAAADGWIVDLGQNTVGRFVKKNEFLASYYQKDLLYTERLFLLSIPANEPLQTQTRISARRPYERRGVRTRSSRSTRCAAWA
jgi:Cu(I)/Ag(I) efflux system membrane fusion protein